MGLRVNRGALLVGVIAVLILVLVFLLVPTITADAPPTISQIGNIPADPYNCYVYDPTKGELVVATNGQFIVDSMFEQHPDWYPDVNALMRCESYIEDFSGSAFQFSGNDYPSGINCVVALDSGINKVTTNWNQTVSASGNVTLVCRFKK